MIKLRLEEKAAIKFLKNKLEKFGCDWCLFMGSAALFYGSNRDLGDIDILIRSDMGRVAKLFGVPPRWTYKGQCKTYRISFVSHGIEVEMGNILIFDYLKSNFELTDECVSRVKVVKVDNLLLPLLSPEDVILIKILLQRAGKKGKSDLNDIIGILNKQNIDWPYFIDRVDQINGKEVVFSYVVNKKIKYRGRFVIDQIKF